MRCRKQLFVLPACHRTLSLLLDLGMKQDPLSISSGCVDKQN
jgi:hypothetical protein